MSSEDLHTMGLSTIEKTKFAKSHFTHKANFNGESFQYDNQYHGEHF